MIESCTLFKSSKSFLFSRDDKEVVRYSCSQPPDLIPRQLDVELEEVPVFIHTYLFLLPSFQIELLMWNKNQILLIVGEHYSGGVECLWSRQGCAT